MRKVILLLLAGLMLVPALPPPQADACGRGGFSGCGGYSMPGSYGYGYSPSVGYQLVLPQPFSIDISFVPRVTVRQVLPQIVQQSYSPPVMPQVMPQADTYSEPTMPSYDSFSLAPQVPSGYSLSTGFYGGYSFPFYRFGNSFYGYSRGRFYGFRRPFGFSYSPGFSFAGSFGRRGFRGGFSTSGGFGGGFGGVAIAGRGRRTSIAVAGPGGFAFAQSRGRRR